LRVMVLTLPEPWASAYGGASGNRRTCLLKIQVGPHWDQAGALSAPDTVAQRSNDAVIEMAPDGVASEHGSADTASDAKRLTRLESDDAGVNVLKAASGSAGRLLLIEDNEMMRSALLPMLLEAGLRVTTAASLREAIHCWQPGRFDLVITDRNLGEDSILPLLDKMAAVGSLHPVLLMTADPFEHPAVYATLAKPFALAAFQPFLDAGIKAMHSMKAETRRLKGFTP
jgi:CheY-like chemotaxis protein